MKLDVTIDRANLRRVSVALEKLSGQQLKAALAAAINDTGHMVRKQMGEEMRKTFDRVTPFIERSPKLVPATPERLEASILPTVDARNLPSKGGKVGVDPQQVLQAQELGGRRRDKKSEKRLRQAGLLPAGYQTAIPKDPYPGSDDGRGNLRGAFMQMLLSYLQTYNEAGYKANMGAKKKAALEGRTTYSQLSNKREVKSIGGVVFFVHHGAMRGGRGGTHLAPGIWAKSGTHGVVLRPVLMFIKAPSYSQRLSMERIAQSSGAQDHLDKRVRFRVRQAAGM